MDTKKFKEIINKISSLDPNSSDEIEKCWNEEIDILAENVNGTISYINNECTEDEYVWISEIIDDLINATKSKELLDAYKELEKKYPDAYSSYNISFCIECAETALPETK